MIWDILETMVTLAIILYLAYSTIRRQHAWTTPLRLWRQAYADGSRRVRVLTNLNYAYQQAGNFVEADKWAAEVLKVAPDMLAVKLNRASALANHGDLDGAIAYLAPAMAKCPKVWQGWKVLGSLYEHRQNWTEAAYAYRHALQIKPDETDLYNQLGSIVFRLALMNNSKGSNLEEAYDCFQRAYRLNPSNGVYAYNLGMVCYKSENQSEAKQWLDRIPEGCLVPGELRDLLKGKEIKEENSHD